MPDSTAVGCSRAPRGDRPEAARPARALAAASGTAPRGAEGAALNKEGKSEHACPTGLATQTPTPQAPTRPRA
jgi:hypothetical protein